MAMHPAKTQTTLQLQAQGTQDMSWLSRTYKLTWLHPAKTQTTLQLQAQGTQDMSWLSRTYKLTWLCTQQRHRPPCNRRHRAHKTSWLNRTYKLTLTVHPTKTQTTLQSKAQGIQTCHGWTELINWHGCAPSKDTDHLAIAGTGHSDVMIK